MKPGYLLIAIFVATCLFADVSSGLSKAILDQIDASKTGVNNIKKLVLSGNRKSNTYNRLANFVDHFPTRLSGSDALEKSIDYLLNDLRLQGFENVHGENVSVPKWTRGKEYAEILTPVRRSMSVLALGTSIGTGGANLTGPVIVVRSFEELEQKKDKVNGTVVVYNQPWTGYGSTVRYRSGGASFAAKFGAIAALVKSVTPFSIYSPHTGAQNYDARFPKIPVASITVEDAELLQRYYDRSENITISMYSEAQNYDNTISRNVVAEIKGSTHSDQVVIFGGHIDNWDVGTGSMDDGGGIMISMEALSVIKSLNLIPKRTLRLVLWTSEEFGLDGGEAYYEAHKNESENVSLIMESDHGVFNPKGLHFTGCGYARAIMEEILKPLSDLNASTIVEGGGDSSDTGWWVIDKNVPGSELSSADENYFFFHHSHGDTMTVLDKDQLDRATVLWATTVYSVANLDDVLPRTGEYPVTQSSVAPSSIAPSSMAKPSIQTSVLASLCFCIWDLLQHTRI